MLRGGVRGQRMNKVLKCFSSILIVMFLALVLVVHPSLPHFQNESALWPPSVSTKALVQSKEASPPPAPRRVVSSAPPKPRPAASTSAQTRAVLQNIPLQSIANIVTNTTKKAPVKLLKPDIFDGGSAFALLDAYFSEVFSPPYALSYATIAEALVHQRRTSTRDLDLPPVAYPSDSDSNQDGHLSDSDPTYLVDRIAFINWSARLPLAPPIRTRVAIGCLWAGDRHTMAAEILPWIEYHRGVGVVQFYLGYDGADPQVLQLLRSLAMVAVLPLQAPLSTAEERARWENHRSAWEGREGNYKLMDKQDILMKWALERARAADPPVDWMFHVDVDEAVHAYGPSGRVDAALAAVPPGVRSLRLPNHEAQLEAGDVTDRMRQVTLFRAHRAWVSREASTARSRATLGAQRNFFLVYGNGKSAARVNHPGVRLLGPHLFWGPGNFTVEIARDLAVLHYSYTSLRELRSKAARTRCPEDVLHQALRQANTSALAPCIILGFDRDVKLAVAAGTEVDLFWSRLVLTEGSVAHCAQGRWCSLREVQARLVPLLLRAGVMQRLTGPMRVLGGQDRAFEIWRRLAEPMATGERTRSATDTGASAGNGNANVTIAHTWA